MSPLISLSGLQSGLDTDAVINQLLTYERMPRQRIELRQSAVQARQEALRDITTRLNSLKTAVADLRSVLTWGEVQAAESSDPTKVAVRRTAGAGPGGHTVEVTSLASAEQRAYTFTAQASASQLTIGTTTIDLAANATLADTVAAINGSTAGVYAVDVGGKLVLSSKTTGAASNITASGAGIVEDPAGFRDGADAVFKVDGVDRTSASNVVTDAIPGLELTLKAPTSGAVGISVGNPAPDQKLIADKVKAFVDAYNATVDAVRTKISEKRAVNPATASEARKGALFGDTTLSGMLSSLRSVVGSSFAANPAASDALADLGITTGAASGSGTVNPDSVAGKLVLDASKLTDLLTSDPGAVKKLLGGDGVDGVAQALENVLTPLTQAGGVLASRVSAADTELAGIKEQLLRFDSRLSQKESRLREQFTALEQALMRSQSVQSDLAARLSVMGL